jgi:hypothetical protein
LSATKGGARRVIVVPDESAAVFGDLTMVGAGKEVVVAASEIVVT